MLRKVPFFGGLDPAKLKLLAFTSRAARFGAGEPLITNAPRGTTVRAKGPVRALRIAGDVFLRLLTDNPGCALHVMRELSGRVNTGNARLAAALRDVEALKAKLRSAEGTAS